MQNASKIGLEKILKNRLELGLTWIHFGNLFFLGSLIEIQSNPCFKGVLLTHDNMNRGQGMGVYIKYEPSGHSYTTTERLFRKSSGIESTPVREPDG